MCWGFASSPRHYASFSRHTLTRSERPWEQRTPRAPPVDTLGQTIGFTVESRHWHTVRNLRCEIACPDGDRSVIPAALMPQGVLAPGHSSLPIELPPHGPGRYKLPRMMDAEDRSQPLVIAKDT